MLVLPFCTLFLLPSIDAHSFIDFLFGIARIQTKYPRCGETPISPLITDQVVQNAKPYSWPWEAAICLKHYVHKERSSKMHSISTNKIVATAKDEYQTDCSPPMSGAVVDRNWVLGTVYKFRTDALFIKTGIFDRYNTTETSTQVRKVKNVFVYPKFDGNYKYDLALYELSAPLEFTPQVQPICLPSKDEMVARHNYTAALVTGWGSKKGELWPLKAHRELQQKHVLTYFDPTDPDDYLKYSILIMTDSSAEYTYSKATLPEKPEYPCLDYAAAWIIPLLDHPFHKANGCLSSASIPTRVFRSEMGDRIGNIGFFEDRTRDQNSHP
ncbi:trypsin domain-containing protein [Ditylenchus destructor]|nr:trypsin domain-containing protein [Ditylenchus destructor]